MKGGCITYFSPTVRSSFSVDAAPPAAAFMYFSAGLHKEISPGWQPLGKPIRHGKEAEATTQIVRTNLRTEMQIRHRLGFRKMSFEHWLWCWMASFRV